MIDFHAKGADLYRRIMTDAEDMTHRVVSGISATFAAQKDGAVVSDQHRVLNFQGAGVSVVDDPVARRTNVLIAGSATTSTPTNLVFSTTAAKALSLWNGSSNNTPPSGWETIAFNDSAWPTATATTVNPSSVTTITGATQLWPTNTPQSIDERSLFRFPFTAPTGTYQVVTATIECDNDITAAYFNGTFLGSVLGNPGHSLARLNISVPPNLVVVGGANVLAVEGTNRDPTVVAVGSAWLASKISGTIATVAPAFTNTAVAFLGANVTMTTANTYYDGASVSLTSGTWLVMAAVDVLSNGPGGTMVAAKLWNGTTVYATAETFAGVSGASSTTFVSALFTLGSTTTVKVSAAGQLNNLTLRSSLIVNGAGNNCTYIMALQIS